MKKKEDNLKFMYCIHCGKEIAEGSKFCTYCGGAQNIGGNTANNTDGNRSNDSSSNDNSKGGMFDNLGEKINSTIEDTAKEFEGEFKNFEQSASKTFEGAAGKFEQAAGAAGDMKKNWRDYMTPDNYEKFAAFALLLPFMMGMVNIFISRIFGLLSLIPGVGFIFGIVPLLVKILFLVCTGAGIAASAYQIATYKNKQATWAYVTLAGNVLAFISCLGSIAGWHGVSFFLGLVCLILAIDTISRVVLQNKGMESAPSFGEDMHAYREKYDQYKEYQDKNDENKGYPESYFDGEGTTLLGLIILSVLVSMVSCGIAAPWMICKVTKWKLQHTVIDGRRLDFDGDGATLLGNWILWEVLTVITCGIYSFFVFVALKKWELKHTFYADDPTNRGIFDGNSLQFLGYGILEDVIILLTCGLGTPWAITMVQRWLVRHSVIGEDRLKFVGTALGLLGQFLIIWLLTCVTCGIYYPWGVVRMNKYLTSHTHVDR
ncbi:MAG: DUF898 family protein [Lachnospiraceae bacterium]|nr:DUF898 family protein [Lachnospiraceae bacterium]